LYADQKELFDQLSDQKAGILIKHVFKYVNDEDPKSKDMIINLAFTPIKQQLKRDLKHWEDVRQKRSDAGKLGGRPKKQTKAKKPNASFDKQTKAKKAVIDNVNVNVNVNDTVNVKDTVIKKEVIFPFNTEKFKEQWQFWKDYKKDEFSFKYKTTQSEQAALKKLAELSKNNEGAAIEIIHQSFANGWKGFFEIKNDNDGKKKDSQNRGKIDEYLRVNDPDYHKY
jgi:hypothetical protein